MKQGKHRPAESIKSFFWTKLYLASPCLTCPEKSPVFTARMASVCPSQTEALHLSPHLSGDLRPFEVLVACEPFSSSSSQFLFLTRNTQPQRAPLKTVWRQRNTFAWRVPETLGHAVKKIYFPFFKLLPEFTEGFLCPLKWGWIFFGHSSWFFPCLVTPVSLGVPGLGIAPCLIPHWDLSLPPRWWL